MISSSSSSLSAATGAKPPHVGGASLAIFTQMRQAAPEILQAKINLEAQQLKSQDISPVARRPA